MVIDRNREALFSLLLADDVGIEELVDLPWLRQAVPLEFSGLSQLLLDDLVAQVNALIADVHARAGYQLLDLLLALSAERALQQITAIAHAWCHPDTPSP